MASPDVELFQSFCRKYINKGVKNHFQDVSGDDDGHGRKFVITGRGFVMTLCKVFAFVVRFWFEWQPSGFEWL